MDGNASGLASDVAFTDAVKAEQARRGSREGYARAMEKQDWETQVTPDLAAFLAERDSFFMASVSSDGHPALRSPTGLWRPSAGWCRR
jgi:uncharacterized protein